MGSQNTFLTFLGVASYRLEIFYSSACSDYLKFFLIYLYLRNSFHVKVCVWTLMHCLMSELTEVVSLRSLFVEVEGHHSYIPAVEVLDSILLIIKTFYFFKLALK